jgi:hypothetical protein
MQRRRKFINQIFGLAITMGLGACGQKEAPPSLHMPTIPQKILQNITLESAIEFLFQVTTIAIPIGRFFKLSYSLGAGILSIDAKMLIQKGELSFKLPFSKDQRIESRDSYIQELQQRINKLEKNLKIVDDNTILIVFRDAHYCSVLPVKENGASVCFFTSGAHTTEIQNASHARIIEIEPQDNMSFFEVGSCSDLKKRENIIIELDPDTSRGRYSDFEVLDAATGEWKYIGRPPQVRTNAQDGNLRIRLRDSSEVVWDGSFDRNDLHPDCRSHHIIVSIFDQDYPPTSKIKCVK